MSFLVVRHNMEVAHRLYELEGKCEQIHGHSMWVDLKLYGQVNKHGVLEGISFGDLKKEFRSFLDSTFDHHLLLNEQDPWAGPVALPDGSQGDGKFITQLPGLMVMPGDPTTENLAKWIAEWAVLEFKLPADVVVHETDVNAAGYSAKPNGATHA